MNYRDHILTLARRVMKMISIAALSVFICMLILAGLLLAYSPGKPKPFTDGQGNPLAGSLSEKIFINIGGLRQGMFIMSKDTSQPVLLYLHGGMPDYFLAKKHPTGLEDCFTVVWWEQRGSGLSCSRDIPAETMNREQMISDVLELADYLRNRFGKEKIYLMGHSGGSFLGIQAAARAPELFHAYVGVAQMSDQLKSERLAWEYMLGQYEEKGKERMARKLAASAVTEGTPLSYLKLRDKAMHRLGIGTMHEMHSVITGIFLESLKCRDYTVNEKIRLWRGKSRSGVSMLWEDMLATNLMERVPRLEIPVYIMAGVHDYTVSSTLAKEYFGKLEAPVKGFYSFEKSAHSPLFEEPGRMLGIMRDDVLRASNSLAD